MLVLRLILCLVVLLPVPAWAAITFDHITNMTPTQSTTTITTSFTVASCTNCIMLVCFASSASTTLASISSITFNGTGLTFANAQGAGAGPAWGTAIYQLVNPSVTTANVVVTVSNTNDDRAMGGSIVLFQGVDQASPIDASNTGGGSGATLSTIVTTIAANAWLMDCAIGADNAGLTVGAGQTQRANYTGGFNTEGFGVSTVDGKASPGNETMDWTQVSAGWGITAVSLKPFVSAGTTPLQQGGVRRGF